MLKVVHGRGLDPDAGKARFALCIVLLSYYPTAKLGSKSTRRDQLVLPEDPTFVPGLMLSGLNLDLSALDIMTVLQTPRKMTSLLSSCHNQSNRPDQAFDNEVQLNLSSSLGGYSTVGGLGLLSEMSSNRKGPQMELPAYLGDKEGVLLQPDFEFDAEGNIVELSVHGKVDHTDVDRTGQNQQSLKIGSANKSGIEEVQNMQLEDMPIYDEDVREMVNVNTILPFEESPCPRHQGHDRPAMTENTSDQNPQQSEKKRRLRAMEVDDYPELSNTDLAQWNSEYAQNMASAAKVKEANKLITIAKKNAAFCVLEVGIGAVGMGLGMARFSHPLEIFSGSRLLSTLTGSQTDGPRRKRDRSTESSSDESNESKRRVRQRSRDIETARGQQVENEAFLPFHDIEIGRHALPSLQGDISLQMPWNVTASIHSSHRGSSVVGPYSGIGGPNSALRSGQDLQVPNSISGRRGRLPIASPLAGRGRMQNTFLGVPLQDEDLDMDIIGGMDVDSYMDEVCMKETTGLSSPSAHRDKIAQPSWFLSNLDQQTVNFLEYVKTRGKEMPGTEMSFAFLFPPGQNTRVVATHGLLHVLTLATNGVLQVRQDVDISFARGCDDVGEILLSVRC
ncbi:R8 protein [Ophidiomyces ophidiicola]|nr:R8 protein [Ophidiomyces ophidiicola]